MLNEREREVLRLTAEGLSAAETGLAIGLATETVKYYRSSLLRKLEARNMAQAVHHGHSLGLLDASGVETLSLADTLGEPTRDFDHGHVGVLARAGLIAEAASFTRAWLGA